jgi:hypothetical protein
MKLLQIKSLDLRLQLDNTEEEMAKLIAIKSVYWLASKDMPL